MQKQPPFAITPKILESIEFINRELGYLEFTGLQRVDVELRRMNKLKSIHSSLAIEGNTLTLAEIASIESGVSVPRPSAAIREAENALQVYADLKKWDALNSGSLLEAHRQLMFGLVSDAGEWRRGGVAVYKGNEVTHMAPPARQVPTLMARLFEFLQNDQHSWLIKAAVFHYEFEFIHPFSDGNGRMGRLWQQIILMRSHPVLEFVSAESIVRQFQQQYYDVLKQCDDVGDSTAFIEFALEKLLLALKEMPRRGSNRMDYAHRVAQAKESFGIQPFSRKDYIAQFAIASATASRDLAQAVAANLLKKTGDKALTRYHF